MQDQRSDVVLNYANNPTGQAPGGFYPGYMGAGVPVLTVREYVQVSGAPIPVYTRHQAHPGPACVADEPVR